MVDDIIRNKGFLALGTRMRRIGERLQADVQRLIDSHDLPILSHHYPILFAIDENGPMEVGQLARALGASQPGVTRSIGQLSASGCVTISSSASDRRVRRVELTEHGQSVMRVGRGVIAPRVLGAFEAVFAAQSSEFLGLLDRLEDALETATLSALSEDLDEEKRDE